MPAWLAAGCALLALALPLLGLPWFVPLALAPVAIFLGIIARGMANRGAAFGFLGSTSFALGVLAILLLFVWVNLATWDLGPYAGSAEAETDEPVDTFTGPESDQGPQPTPEALDL